MNNAQHDFAVETLETDFILGRLLEPATVQRLADLHPEAVNDGQGQPFVFDHSVGAVTGVKLVSPRTVGTRFRT
ncbi:MAG: hypothetical protein IID45_03455 [Planctomycetes bacterium]|nr:hypothetical protein [Planctomycetota bacterium]